MGFEPSLYFELVEDTCLLVYTLFGLHGVSGLWYGFCHVSSALVDVSSAVFSGNSIDYDSFLIAF